MILNINTKTMRKQFNNDTFPIVIKTTRHDNNFKEKHAKLIKISTNFKNNNTESFLFIVYHKQIISFTMDD